MRLLLLLLAFVATGTVGALKVRDEVAGSDSCAPQQTQQSRSEVRFRSSFEQGDFDEWGGYNRVAQPEQYPAGAHVLDPGDDGVPRREGCRVARFDVTLDDARARRTHAKLIYSWKVGQGHFRTSPPDDVSGVYSAWYYVPEDYRLGREGWVNIFQWKESYYEFDDNGERQWHSDPAWWITLERGRRGGLVALLNNWVGDVTASKPFPRGRWVQVRAVLREGRSIVVSIGGKRLGVASADDYPVSPQYRDYSLSWNFGVGNYSGRGDGPAGDAVSGPLYVDDIRVRPLR